jgi:uncharacterized damage-inducible protein DinB
MQPLQIITLFNYHWSTTESLLEGASQLDETTYHADPEYGQGSIHKLLFHILAADHGWRIGLESREQQIGLNVEAYPNIETLRSLLKAERDAWKGFLEQLSEADLQGEVTIKTLRGHARTFPLWKILVHLMLHGMQHHSELSQLLSTHGLSPGNIDFIFYTE